MSGSLGNWSDHDRLGQDGPDGDLLPVLFHEQGSTRQALDTGEKLPMMDPKPYQLGLCTALWNFHDPNPLSATD